jgi:hypothetical protein
MPPSNASKQATPKKKNGDGPNFVIIEQKAVKLGASPFLGQK